MVLCRMSYVVVTYQVRRHMHARNAAAHNEKKNNINAAPRSNVSRTSGAYHIFLFVHKHKGSALYPRALSHISVSCAIVARRLVCISSVRLRPPLYRGMFALLSIIAHQPPSLVDANNACCARTHHKTLYRIISAAQINLDRHILAVWIAHFIYDNEHRVRIISSVNSGASKKRAAERNISARSTLFFFDLGIS